MGGGLVCEVDMGRWWFAGSYAGWRSSARLTSPGPRFHDFLILSPVTTVWGKRYYVQPLVAVSRYDF